MFYSPYKILSIKYFKNTITCNYDAIKTAQRKLKRKQIFPESRPSRKHGATHVLLRCQRSHNSLRFQAIVQFLINLLLQGWGLPSTLRWTISNGQNCSVFCVLRLRFVLCALWNEQKSNLILANMFLIHIARLRSSHINSSENQWSCDLELINWHTSWSPVMQRPNYCKRACGLWESTHQANETT